MEGIFAMILHAHSVLPDRCTQDAGHG